PQAAATPEYASGRVIVRFKSGTVIAQNVDQLGMTFDKPFGVQGGAVYNIADGSSVEEKVAELNALNAVEFAEPDYRVRLSRTPNDAQYAQQWHHPVIGSPNAWDSVTGSASIGVCIVDSGVRKNHPDLAGSIAGGWNLVPAIQKDGQPPPTPSDPAYTAYDDKVGHGTHVAGIVAAIGNNSRGVAGVAWKAKIYVCKFIWDDESGYISDAMTCLGLCRDAGAMIASNSWGGIPYSDFLKNEIQAAGSAGQLFINSAGNTAQNLDSTPSYPAAYNLPTQITVAATTLDDSISNYSCYGKKTAHISSPGDAILSTTVDGNYGLMWGTSMAAPVVAGAAVLVQAAAQSRGKTLTPVEIKSFLMSNVDRVSDSTSKTIAGGRI
ncbi:hypothetical protein H632_c3077p0, partial [Helicosporidium sp. ATCC 50920]